MIEDGIRHGGKRGKRKGACLIAQLSDCRTGLHMGERYVRRSCIYTTNEGEDGAHVKERERIPEPVFCGQLEAVPAAGLPLCAQELRV